jgi:hypothetical protein
VPLSTLSADNLLNAWATTYSKYGSLHTAYSASGANEVTGGSPAYARQALTWGSAASNSMALTGTYTWNVPGSTTVYWVGFWDAVTSGNFQGMAPAGNASAYAFTVPSSTSTFTAPGSAYSSNQQVVIVPTGGSTTPGGITVGTVYYVKSPSGDTFQLSASAGPGSAVSISADGSGLIQVITPEAFGSQGVFTLSSGSASQV